MLPPTPTQLYLVSIRFWRKISFVTSFIISNWPKKYYYSYVWKYFINWDKEFKLISHKKTRLSKQNQRRVQCRDKLFCPLPPLLSVLPQGQKIKEEGRKVLNLPLIKIYLLLPLNKKIKSTYDKKIWVRLWVVFH